MSLSYSTKVSLGAIFFLQIVSIPEAASAQRATGRAPGEITPHYYLVGDLEEGARITVTTDKGAQQGRFNGQIAFRVTPRPTRSPGIELVRLNLVGEGVNAVIGDCGLIGLKLSEPAYKVRYGARSGRLDAGIETILHYSLIDKIKGFRQVQVQGELNLPAYTESMIGRLSGRLQQDLRQPSSERVPFEGRIDFALDDPVVGAIQTVRLNMRLVLERIRERAGLTPADMLTIQPVFIGSGPSDPSATGSSRWPPEPGSAFDTLYRNAFDMWGRCGTERCLHFIINRPIYIDNDAYRVIDSEFEARAFVNELDIPGAVEIFVAERLEFALSVEWGGGGTLGGGMEGARIVTSEQQLDVPCDSPCDWPDCGEVNPFHLAHEMGHVFDLAHPDGTNGTRPSSWGSVMQGSGFCFDNPDLQSALNCRNASNPLLRLGYGRCGGTPDIAD